jgi:hypothetical protein
MRSRIAIALGLALVSAPAVAQKAPKDDTLPLEGARQHDEGEYGGVEPGQPQTTEGGKTVRRAASGTLTWVGFKASDGVGHVFVQSSGDLGFDQHVEGKTIVVRLSGVKRLGRQVRRPLDTRYFDSPVARITVKKVRAHRARKKHPAQKAGVEVRIFLKSAADAREASVRTAVEADGYNYIYLDVAGSSEAPAATP